MGGLLGVALADPADAADPSLHRHEVVVADVFGEVQHFLLERGDEVLRP